MKNPAAQTAAQTAANTAAKVRAFAFTGPSNSGKTTLICKISKALQHRGLRVGIIKHDPGDKAVFDTPAKDSGKFYATGAEVAVLSPARTTIFSHQSTDVLELIAAMRADIVLVEGLKTLPLPRMCVFCKEIDESYLPHAQAVASYQTGAKSASPVASPDAPENPKRLEELSQFWLDDIDAIATFVLENAKEIK